MQEPDPSENDSLLAEFERDGEPVIRKRVEIGEFADPRKHAIAKVWLEEKARAHEAIRQKWLRLERAEQKRLARTAKDAAWVATVAAAIAVICATISILLSAPVRNILGQ
jgi:CHASE3 domain sensor protein